MSVPIYVQGKSTLKNCLDIKSKWLRIIMSVILHTFGHCITEFRFIIIKKINGLTSPKLMNLLGSISHPVQQFVNFQSYMFVWLCMYFTIHNETLLVCRIWCKYYTYKSWWLRIAFLSINEVTFAFYQVPSHLHFIIKPHQYHLLIGIHHKYTIVES